MNINKQKDYQLSNKRVKKHYSLFIPRDKSLKLIYRITLTNKLNKDTTERYLFKEETGIEIYILVS